MSVASLLGSGSLVDEVVGIDESLKLCSKCNEWKDRSAFSKRKEGTEALRSQCKSCVNAYNAKLKNKPKIKVEEKICSQCGQLKPIDEFNKDQKTADKRFASCKTCLKINYMDKRKFKQKTEVEEKKCSTCGEIKTADQFHVNSSNKDSLDYRCIDCRSDYDSRYRKTLQGKAVQRKKRHKRRLISSDLPTDNLTNQLLHKRFRLINVMLFDHCCPYCGKYLEYYDAHLDHFIPVSDFGTNEIHNIIHCCLSCNSSKQDKYPYKWLMNRYIDDLKLPFNLQMWQDITSPDWEELVYRWAKSSNDSVVA